MVRARTLLTFASSAWAKKTTVDLSGADGTGGWTLEAQPAAAFISAFPLILGIVFMINARTEIVDIMAKGSIPKGNPDQGYFQGVMVHYFFILGIALHAIGVTNLALCLGYPPDLAVIPFFITLTAMALFMALMRTGIAGAPKFSFPPIPGVIGLPVISSVLSWNAYVNWGAYGLTELEVNGLAVLVVVPIVITQGLGAYHRALGYGDAQVDQDFGHAKSK